VTVWSPPAGTISKVAGTAAGSPSGGGPPVTGYAAWYDSSQITGVADGALLGTWPDLSGNGYTLTATGTQRPTYYSSTQTINGLPVVAFSGTVELLLASAPVAMPTATPLSIFLVCKPTSFAGYMNLFNHWGSNPPKPWQWYVDTSGALNFSSGSLAVSSTLSTAGLHLYEVVWDGSTTAAQYIDGASAGSGSVSASAGGTYPFTLGTEDNDNYTFLGLIAEVVYYQTALSAANRQSVENYLRTKWGTP
jgi:hypothetical protein